MILSLLMQAGAAAAGDPAGFQLGEAVENNVGSVGLAGAIWWAARSGLTKLADEFREWRESEAREADVLETNTRAIQELVQDDQRWRQETDRRLETRWVEEDRERDKLAEELARLRRDLETVRAMVQSQGTHLLPPLSHPLAPRRWENDGLRTAPPPGAYPPQQPHVTLQPDTGYTQPMAPAQPGAHPGYAPAQAGQPVAGQPPGAQP